MQKQNRDDRRFSFLAGKSRKWLDDNLDAFEEFEEDEHDGWSAIRPRRANARPQDVTREDGRL